MSKNKTSPDFDKLKKYLNGNGKLGNGRSVPDIDESIMLDALNKITNFDGSVRINITGLERPADFENAWRAMGIDTTLGKKIETELGLTWHHLDDLDADLKSTMQIVITEIHEATLLHMGSHAQIKRTLNLKSK